MHSTLRRSKAAIARVRPDAIINELTSLPRHYTAADRAHRTAPVQWRLVVRIGQAGDPTDDATIPWPSDRQHIDVGTLTINHIEGEAPGNCRNVNFDPLVLPSWIEPSDDPLLSARSAAYSTSFTRRAGEEKEPSAVQIPASGEGA